MSYGENMFWFSDDAILVVRIILLCGERAPEPREKEESSRVMKINGIKHALPIRVVFFSFSIACKSLCCNALGYLGKLPFRPNSSL